MVTDRMALCRVRAGAQAEGGEEDAMARHTVKRLLLVGLTALTVGGVLSACADDPDPEPLVVTDPGTIFEAEVGDRVTIVLESNATTGYAWELERPPPADVVRFVDDRYVAPDSELVGAGGHQRLTFEAVGEGTAEIALWYVRSFDDPIEPADRATFEIVVS